MVDKVQKVAEEYKRMDVMVMALKQQVHMASLTEMLDQMVLGELGVTECIAQAGSNNS